MGFGVLNGVLAAGALLGRSRNGLQEGEGNKRQETNKTLEKVLGEGVGKLLQERVEVLQEVEKGQKGGGNKNRFAWPEYAP